MIHEELGACCGHEIKDGSYTLMWLYCEVFSVKSILDKWLVKFVVFLHL